MFDKMNIFKKKENKKEPDKKDIEEKKELNKDAAKERLHLVLVQDRVNVSADFIDMMKQELIDVVKKYVDIDEGSLEVKLNNEQNNDGTMGAPTLYVNIPIAGVKNETRKFNKDLKKLKDESKDEQEKTDKKQENTKESTHTDENVEIESTVNNANEKAEDGASDDSANAI